MNRLRVTLFVVCLLTIGPALGTAQGGRFAWLSDTHIGSSATDDDLRGAIRDINEMPDVEFVVLSGDVTEFGSIAQLHAAKALLDGLRKPYYLVPGNHDTKWSESGTTMFRKIFGDERFVFDWKGYRFIGLHQGPRMRMTDGYWAPEDLRWLDSVLAKLPDMRQRIFIVTHYPVDSSIANWYEVLDRVKGFNVQAILVGHGHRNRAESFEGIPGAMGRSTLHAKESTGGFTVAEVLSDTMTLFEHRIGSPVRQPWHRILLGSRDYQSDTNRYPRPDFRINKVAPEILPLWHFKSGYTIGSAPAIMENLVAIGDASGTVYGLNRNDGRVRWKFSSGGPVYSSPAAALGSVVFGSADGTVYCVSASNGILRWSRRTDAPVVAAPAIENNRVFIGGGDGKFRCLDFSSGKVLWEFSGLGGFVECKPLLYGGKVIFGAWDSSLYALDATTGELRWKWEGDSPGILFSPAACWTVGAHGKVFFVAPDRMMTALEVNTGRQVWRSARHQVRETIGISADSERIYVRTLRDSVIALDSRADEPHEVWIANVGFGYDINSAMITEKEGRVLYGTKNGLILALDAKSGKILWRHKAGVAPLNTVLPIGGDEVIVSDMGGVVQRLRIAKTGMN